MPWIPPVPARALTIYQLKITLKDLRPLIWRRFQVPGDYTLDRLHRVIQRVMGWTDSHLHEYIVRGRHYGTPSDEWEGPPVVPERSARLCDVAPREKARFVYVYDFGDSWEHDVLVEKIVAPQPGQRYPVCLAGQRACPPEDCGGYPGYIEFVAATSNPAHPEHAEMLEWVGGAFDPWVFDLDGVNRALRRFRR
ncbi:MAG: plasmid pRiA4b ORF-3 family protein [Candidatus Rokubacteria bacterium]|nr:plasmid pRiA4b ORF-3 family protein [Candidatus Rokubacteria bacterium]